jgi:geranylgeranyl pyrophosphate synthase
MITLDTVQIHFEKQRAPADEELGKLLPAADTHPSRIHEAMDYSVFAGGEWLRSILAT